MKKILLTVLMSSALATNYVLAESGDSVHVPSSPYFSTVYSVMENKEEVRVSGNQTKGKYRANSLIEERIKALSSNVSAIADNKKLTTEQKSLLTTQLTTSSANLTALKNSIASSTDATSTKLLIDSIFKDFRIYGIVIPKVRIESRIYQLKNHTETLSQTFSKIQTKIDESEAQGRDVSLWQKGLDDAKVLVAGEMFKLDDLLKKTATLTPQSYGTTSKEVIDSVNRDLKLISKELNTVVGKVRKPYNLKKVSTSTTVSATSSSR